MQARIVSARQGARWLAEGWRLFRAAPFGWLALVFAYWFIMTVVSIVPYVGVAVASVLVPGFSVGFMAAARSAERRGGVELGLLFDGFRHDLQAQLWLGVAYLACLAAVLASSAVADGGALAQWMLAGERPEEAVQQSDDFFLALVSAALLYLPVMMLFWFAPLLVAWHSTAPVKALFFSLFAFLMNWRAFLAYCAVAALVTLAVPFAVMSVLLIGSGGAAAIPLASLVFPLLIVLLPTLFASFYASYRDVFGAEPA